MEEDRKETSTAGMGRGFVMIQTHFAAWSWVSEWVRERRNDGLPKFSPPPIEILSLLWWRIQEVQGDVTESFGGKREELVLCGCMSDLARNFRKWAPFEMQFEAKS
jgi:hypothetical protein